MLNETQNALLGAMIGLVRAAEKNGKTDETDRLLLEGSAAVRNDAVTESLLRRVQTEKQKAAPGCALCAMPCGSTDDADMTSVWRGEKHSVALKKEMLEQVFALADRLQRTINADEGEVYLLHKGLFYIGEYAAPDELTVVLEEIKTYIDGK